MDRPLDGTELFRLCLHPRATAAGIAALETRTGAQGECREPPMRMECGGNPVPGAAVDVWEEGGPVMLPEGYTVSDDERRQVQARRKGGAGEVPAPDDGQFLAVRSLVLAGCV